MFKTIVVAMDGSEGSRQACSVAAEMARDEGAKLVLVHVAEHTIGKGGGDVTVGQEELKETITEEAEQLSSGGLDVSVEVRDEMVGGPAHVIADVAGEVGADLIVAGTRGHSSVAGLLLGSVTHRLLHIAGRPVLAVPSAE